MHERQARLRGGRRTGNPPQGDFNVYIFTVGEAVMMGARGVSHLERRSRGDVLFQAPRWFADEPANSKFLAHNRRGDCPCRLSYIADSSSEAWPRNIM